MRFRRQGSLRLRPRPILPFAVIRHAGTRKELLLAALSSCHQLAYLHLCAVAGIVVVDYFDHAEGVMAETPDGAAQFTRVLLRPKVTIAAGSDVAKALALHHEAHERCFIARSVNFPVEHEAEIR